MIKKLHMTTAILAALSVRAFNNAGWKKDADGKIALDGSGNPIYLKEDGSEMTVDSSTIGRLNGEAKSFRERAEKAEASAKAYEGLDAAKAREALETVSKLDHKKLIDAGEVDKVKAEITAAMQAQLDEQRKANEAVTGERDNLTKQLAFKGSEFIRDRIAVPQDMFEATFDRNFKVENGKTIPYGADGNPIYSKKRAGELADIDEAFEILVDRHPHKDRILKAPDKGGTGNNGGAGGQGRGRIIKRGDFNQMNPQDQAATMASAQKGEVQVVD